MKSKLKSYTIKWKPKHKIKNRIIKVQATNKREAKGLLLQELAKVNEKCFEPVFFRNLDFIGGKDDNR